MQYSSNHTHINHLLLVNCLLLFTGLVNLNVSMLLCTEKDYGLKVAIEVTKTLIITNMCITTPTQYS